MNFGLLLDKLIALVIVILLLSLVVQTVQSTLKKLLKIKSRQIEGSLLDLFQSALGQPSALRSGLWALLDASPVLQTVFSSLGSLPAGIARRVGRLAGKQPPVFLPGTPERLRAEVLAYFGRLGRFAQSGRPILDSLSKDDLLLVLTQMEPRYLLGDDQAARFLEGLRDAVEGVVALAGDMEALAHDPLLRGEASARFSELRAVFAPLVTDCRTMLTGAPPALKPELLAHDLLALRQLKPRQAMELLASVQGKVQTDLDGAKTDVERQGHQDLSGRLSAVARDFGSLQVRFDAVTATLRVRLAGIERWFDTVMQSFEERFVRSMKTWGLVIAFVVVVCLNANFFHLYNKVSASDDVRRQILASQAAVQQRAARRNTPASDPGETQGDAASPLTVAQQGASDVQQDAAFYTDLGFQPLSRAQVRLWWSHVGREGWLMKTLVVLLGWSLTTMLLSAGAPFWEDVLESLFGLKNLLRKGSETRNVEDRRGTGQPKT